MDEPLSGRTAILVVHGVQPHAQYQIQDFCATNLRDQLNGDTYWKSVGQWDVDVVEPHTKPDAPLQATITRVHCKDDFAGSKPFFDIVEGYWSPLDKGRTNFAAVISWLLRTLVVPLNTTAAFAATTGKTVYDFGFILAAAFAGIGIVLGSLYLLIVAANSVLVAQGCAPAECAHLGTLDVWLTAVPKQFNPSTVSALAITAAGGFLVVQAVKGLLSLIFHWKASTPAHALKRLILILAVIAVGSLIMLLGQHIHFGASRAIGLTPAAFFVAAAAAFEAGRSILQQFILNFFQDVMIYTTRDENSEFHDLRSRILGLVADRLEALCAPDACDGKGYERVFVLGHSLGATICLDALIQFYHRCQQGSRDWSEFQRVRGFVTFGAALEKTKYFFDVLDPSPSASTDQWRSDLYGAVFTLAPSALDIAVRDAKTGLLWVNYWYYLDAISNAMDSYSSYLCPGDPIHQASRIRQLIQAKVGPGTAIQPPRICRNEKRFHWYVPSEIVPHDEYLRDDRFWQTRGAVVDADVSNAEDYRPDRLGVLDIVARHATAAKISAAPAGGPSATGSGTVPAPGPAPAPSAVHAPGAVTVTSIARAEFGDPMTFRSDDKDDVRATTQPIDLSDAEIERRIHRVDGSPPLSP